MRKVKFRVWDKKNNRAGDKQDNHLSHAFCRVMMAIGTEVS